MELRTNGLALILDLTHPDEEGWMRCDVETQVPGFLGKFQCEVWLPDLKCFQKELAQMVEQVGHPCSASFATTEPGIKVYLSMNPYGQIQGRYVLKNFDSPGQPSLSGDFEMDQSYLPHLLEEVKKSIP
jgi:hypothetical protein